MVIHGCTAYVYIVGLLRCSAYVVISGILVKVVCLIVLPFFLVNVFLFSISLCSGLRGGREEAKRPEKVAKEEVRRNVLTRRFAAHLER